MSTSKEVLTDKEVDEFVGDQIRMLRLLRGVSREYLAEKLNVPFYKIGRYERGEERVGASKAVRLAEVLKVPVAYFFTFLHD